MATKIKQKPKVSKTSARAKSISGGARGVKTITSHTNPKAPSKGGDKKRPVTSSNPMPTIREYPGEGKGRKFDGVKIVGSNG